MQLNNISITTTTAGTGRTFFYVAGFMLKKLVSNGDKLGYII